MIRNGKIARLPGSIRDELNERLDNAEPGEKLLAWLNRLPEVKKSLQVNFDGAPLSKQNLSEWRQGGFREWQLRREWLEHAHDIEDDNCQAGEELYLTELPGAMAGALALRYAALINTWDGEPSPEFEEKLRLLRRMLQDIALLQRTLQREAEASRAEVVAEKQEEQEKRDRFVNVIHSKLEARIMAEMYGGGEAGRKLAETVTQLKMGLINPEDLARERDELRRMKEEKDQSQAPSIAKAGKGQQSKPVKPAAAKTSAVVEAKADQPEPPASESNSVKPA